ncbi:hypothetical protein LQG66_20585 [Bradyrhizobium ontarionense]|uniref:KTSC domain-containing protein n=1 Tax=Bradyrhizobium ontarionense TaxID=2898149 RepID=A0ABY3R349_9BRAD|nr:hypothetical protein [Bradyrhizobium sp. A19]UFZ01719.1 hypothetical protein LQG66_20585 [Bradyrhizobium sp. A19]
MTIYICNMLGPISTTYRFQDGDMITRVTRESLAYVHRGVSTEVLFWYNGAGAFEYSMPASLPPEERDEFLEKLERYCRNKRNTAGSSRAVVERNATAGRCVSGKPRAMHERSIPGMPV